MYRHNIRLNLTKSHRWPDVSHWLLAAVTTGVVSEWVLTRGALGATGEHDAAGPVTNLQGLVEHQT